MSIEVSDADNFEICLILFIRYLHVSIQKQNKNFSLNCDFGPYS